jgi:hypothetical protein
MQALPNGAESFQPDSASALVRTEMSKDLRLLLLRNFIVRAEQDELRKWAQEMLPLLGRNGYQRAFLRVRDLPWIPESYTTISRRVETRLALQTALPEPNYGAYLSSIGEGGAIHEHIDPAPDGYRHLRCNLFVQIPDSGGNPILEGAVQPFEERMLLCFFPSEVRHSSLTSRGRWRRIVCSFGYLVSVNYDLRSFCPASS